MKLDRNEMPVSAVVTTRYWLTADALLLAGLLLCASQANAQDVNDTDKEPSGVYALVSVNGAKVPADVTHGNVEIQVRSGTFKINADGTCRSKIVFAQPSGAVIAREVDATYTQEGQKLSMQWKGAGKTVGTVDGDSFTMVNEGMVFSYEKQPTLAATDKQKILDKFVGTWRTEYKLAKAEWTPIEKRGSAMLDFSRTLGGKFVHEEGEHADKSTALAMYTYDTERNCYRGWWFSSTGKTSESKGEWDPATNTLAWTNVANAKQNFTMTSQHHFVSDSVFKWDVVAKDRTGKILFQMEGKATRSDKSTN